jgi:hypothetical protein
VTSYTEPILAYLLLCAFLFVAFGFAFVARFAFFFFGDIIGFGGVFSAARNVPMNRRCASSSLYCSSPGDLAMAKKPLARRPEFTQLLGLFQIYWSSLDLTIDYAICQFLKITHHQAHLITGGMMSGPKFRLLVDLIKRSDHPQRDSLRGALNKIRAIQKRDVFAHSYIESYQDSVTFLSRTVGGEYEATDHKFTEATFGAHVKEVAEVGMQFYTALGVTRDELQAFAKAALSLNRK